VSLIVSLIGIALLGCGVVVVVILVVMHLGSQGKWAWMRHLMPQGHTVQEPWPVVAVVFVVRMG